MRAQLKGVVPDRIVDHDAQICASGRLNHPINGQACRYKCLFRVHTTIDRYPIGGAVHFHPMSRKERDRYSRDRTPLGQSAQRRLHIGRSPIEQIIHIKTQFGQRRTYQSRVAAGVVQRHKLFVCIVADNKSHPPLPCSPPRRGRPRKQQNNQRQDNNPGRVRCASPAECGAVRPRAAIPRRPSTAGARARPHPSTRLPILASTGQPASDPRWLPHPRAPTHRADPLLPLFSLHSVFAPTRNARRSLRFGAGEVIPLVVGCGPHGR